MLRDEIAYEIYKTGRASKATMSFEEFVASDCCYADTPTWRDAADAILALEKIRKALSQSQAYDELMEKGGSMSLRDKMIDVYSQYMAWTDAQKLADSILNLPEIQIMKEQSEAFEEMSGNFFKHIPTPGSDDELLYVKKMKQLDLLMDGLWVREQCECFCHSFPDDVIMFGISIKEDCKNHCDCHGTGTITRPATVEEVREMIENSFNSNHWKKWSDYTSGFSFLTLKSGGTLFMKEKK